MSDAQTTKRPRGTRWCSTGIVAAGIGLVAIIVGTLGVRLGIIGTFPAFGAYGFGSLAMIIALIAAGVGLLVSKGTAGGAAAGRTWLALIVALALTAANGMRMAESSGAPPIHDITTDTGNPPFFDAILPLRASAPNPPEYSGKETAELQRTHYPDIQTLTVEKPTDEVFVAAEQAVQDLGWEIVSADPDTGRIEATDTTFWFRFKDDVVIRLTPRGYGTYVDIRSKSRVGMGDMGTNARRVRTFLERLHQATDES